MGYSLSHPWTARVPAPVPLSGLPATLHTGPLTAAAKSLLTEHDLLNGHAQRAEKGSIKTWAYCLKAAATFLDFLIECERDGRDPKKEPKNPFEFCGKTLLVVASLEREDRQRQVCLYWSAGHLFFAAATLVGEEAAGKLAAEGLSCMRKARRAATTANDPTVIVPVSISLPEQLRRVKQILLANMPSTERLAKAMERNE